MKKIFFIICLVFAKIKAREQEKVEFVPEGNLALPTSQQTSPLFCFGQNIVDKGDIQAYMFINSFIGKNNNFTDLIPNVFYGITDDLSVIAGIPIVAQFKVPHQSCSERGFDSIFVQFEYAFYNDDHPTYANQATLVANVSAPLRSPKMTTISIGNVSRPAAIAFPGLESPSFFFGLTASHMATDWYYFASAGAVIPVSFHETKADTQFLYQAGICRNIYYKPHKLIISGLLEFFGTLSKPNKVPCANFAQNNRCLTNIFYIGPSLWIATERFIFDIGIAFPVTKQKNDGTKNTCLFALETGWKFN